MRAGAAIAALALFGCHANSAPAGFAGTAVGTAPAPDFRLTDQDGRPFRLSDQKGKEVVLFFGYTHCPDECPMTLAHLANIVRHMPPADRARVLVAFVTVDPQRDDPATLRRYVRGFYPSFVGLTGSPHDLEATERAYHVWAARLPASESGEYREAHGSSVYLIDPEGRLRVVHGWQDSSAALAADMQKLLGA